VVGLLLGGLARPAAAQLVFTPSSIPDVVAVKGLNFSLTLPEAIGAGAYTLDDGDSDPTTLTLPAGLSYSGRTLSGTPSATAAAKTYTLTGTGNSKTATLTFSLEVRDIAFRYETAHATSTDHALPHLILTEPWTGEGLTCTAPPTSYALPFGVGQGVVTYTLASLDDDGNVSALDLPAGLSFSSTGSPPEPKITIDNTKIAATDGQKYTYRLTATDSATPTANTVTLDFALEIVNEKTILETLYTTTGGANWTTGTDTGWGDPITACPGSLHGVTAQNGRVSALELPDNQLTGPIPPALGGLTALTTLDLRNNRLTGPIPSELGNLIRLTKLSLGDNSLTSVPDVSGLRSLTHLSLNHNHLTSVSDVSGLRSLTHLSLRNNRLTSVPDVSGLTNLVELSLGHNQLTSVDDEAFEDLTRLLTLSLGHNSLTSVPDVSGLGSLTKLYLNHNHLASVDDEDFDSDDVRFALTTLDLSHNRLTSVSANAFRDLKSFLTHLYLNNNKLAGSPPDSFWELVELQVLFLNHNQLTAPPSLGNPKLAVLNLQHNKLTFSPLSTDIPAVDRLWLYGNDDLTDQPWIDATVDLTVTPTTMSEGAGTQTVTVTATLSEAANIDGPFTLQVQVLEGTARPGRDYTAASSLLDLTFSNDSDDPDTQTTASVTTDLTIRDDREREAAETVQLALCLLPEGECEHGLLGALYPGMQPGDTTVVAVTIRDNDTPTGGGGGVVSRPRDDHGNSARRATRIAPSERTAGRLDTRSDVDYFTFTVPHAGMVVIETISSLATQGTLWQDGTEVATADSGGRGWNFRLSARVEAGPVVVAVRGNGRQTGNYILQTAQAVGYLENPGPDSFQSGVGVLSGWVCEAEGVEIEIVQENGEVVALEAAYGTERADTATLPSGEELCGDMDNGFGVLFNWNLLGAGAHEVIARVDGVPIGRRATVDGIELGRATVTVTTLGEAFVEDVAGECTAADFPGPGETVRLMWQEEQQTFVIASAQAPAGESRAGTPGVGYLEVPGPNSFQSGIGVISGWVCEAEQVEIEITQEGGTVLRQAAAYGTERLDTATLPSGEVLCGDTDNGFGLLFNWNLLGAGVHTVAALVDGEELGRATVQVTVVDESEPFARGLVGECTVEDFPSPSETVTLEWQQRQQNFVITGVD